MVHRSFVVMAIVACAAVVGTFALGPEERTVLAGSDPVVIDDFDDGSLSSVWQQISWGTGPSVREANGRLEYTVPADSKDDPVQAGFLMQHMHMCKLSGDFVVEADFNLTAWPEENGTRMALVVGPLAVLRATDAIWGNVYNAVQTGTTLTWFNTSDTSGRMRISREGNIFTGSFNSTGNWQPLASVADTEDDVTPRFQVWTGEDLLGLRPEESRDEDTVVTFDNLTLVSGTLTCGEKVEFTQAIQELQDVSDLVNDLEKEKSPPVPIVAGKPMALRVYFDEVDQSVMRKVELAGEVEREQTVTLAPGCDIEKQREQKDGCDSANFYFTPPEGEWTVAVTTRDGNGGLLSHGEFTIESVKTRPVKVVGVDVCDKKTGLLFGRWECWRGWELWDISQLLRATFPGEVEFAYHTGMVTEEVDNPDSDWWGSVILSLDIMRLLDGLPDAYYHGAVRPNVGGTTSGIGGMGRVSGHTAASRTQMFAGQLDSSFGNIGPHILAHELGHNFGRRHVSSGTAKCFATPKKTEPYPGNAPFIDEVGFNVADRKALPSDEYADVMSYCAPAWVSTHTYKAIVDMFRENGGEEERLASQPYGGPKPSWLISGVIEDGQLDLQPIFTVDAGAPITGDGDFRIEVLDSEDAVLESRAFQPQEAHWSEIEAPLAFAVLVPVMDGAARISVVGPGEEEIASVPAGGTAPLVTVEVDATDVSRAGGTISITWSVDDPDSESHTFMVDYSRDGGATWEALDTGTEETGIILDVDDLPGSAEARVRVLASDGANTGAAISEPFSVPKKLPQAEITSPDAGSSYPSDSLVWLQGFAFDSDDGFLDDDLVEWSSSRDGVLGTGDDLPVYDLSEGVHTVTLAVRDSDGNEARDAITIFVGEGGLTADVDCDGDVDSFDSLKLLRHTAGLPLAQEEGCPPIGTGDPVHGDVNCDGAADAGDALLVLGFVAAPPVDVPAGCPAVAGSGRSLRPPGG